LKGGDFTVAKIKMICSGNPMDGDHFIVGQEGITNIEDKSREWEDGIDFIYCIYKDEKCVAEWDNVPVKITYFEE
jgi:hypothetical protein